MVRLARLLEQNPVVVWRAPVLLALVSGLLFSRGGLVVVPGLAFSAAGRWNLGYVIPGTEKKSLHGIPALRFLVQKRPQVV